MIDIGKMIATIRKERGYSQQQLADKIGTTKQAISNYSYKNQSSQKCVFVALYGTLWHIMA